MRSARAGRREAESALPPPAGALVLARDSEIAERDHGDNAENDVAGNEALAVSFRVTIARCSGEGNRMASIPRRPAPPCDTTQRKRDGAWDIAHAGHMMRRIDRKSTRL